MSLLSDIGGCRARRLFGSLGLHARRRHLGWLCLLSVCALWIGGCKSADGGSGARRFQREPGDYCPDVPATSLVCSDERTGTVKVDTRLVPIEVVQRVVSTWGADATVRVAADDPGCAVIELPVIEPAGEGIHRGDVRSDTRLAALAVELVREQARAPLAAGRLEALRGVLLTPGRERGPRPPPSTAGCRACPFRDWVLKDLLLPEDASRRTDPVDSLVTASLELSPGMTVADIGAGGGYYTFIAAAHVGATGAVYAIDTCHLMCAYLEMFRLVVQAPQVRVVKGDFLPVEDVRFDLVLLVDSVPLFDTDPPSKERKREDVEREFRRIGQLWEALEPGGRVLYAQRPVSFCGACLSPTETLERLRERMEIAGFRTKSAVVTSDRGIVAVFERPAAPRSP